MSKLKKNCITILNTQNDIGFLFEDLKMQNQNTEYLNSIGFSVYDKNGNIELSSHNIGRSSSNRKRIKYVICPFCEEKQLNNVEFCRYCGEFLEPYND